MIPPSEISRVAGGLSPTMRAMLRRSRQDIYNQPPRCYGRASTKAALRNRGLGHGDFCFLTPLGLAVRAHLENEHD